MGFAGSGWGFTAAGTTPSPTTSAQSFEADCPAGLAVGDWVYITGPKVAGRYQVAEADIADYDKLPAVGLAVQKDTSTTAVIQWEGEAEGVFGGLTPHRVYYLQDDGSIGLTPPNTASQYVQRVGVALDSGVLLISLNLHLTKRA